MFRHKFVLKFILFTCFYKFNAEESAECPKKNRANVLQTIVLFDASPENQMDFQQQKDRVIKALRDIDRFSAGRKRFYELIVFHRTPMDRLQSASIDQITEQISTLSMVNSQETSPAKALNEARTIVEKMPQAQSVILLAHDGHNTDLASETLTASARLSKKVPIFAIAGGKTPPALAKLDEYTGGQRRRVFAFEQDAQQFLDALDEEIEFCPSPSSLPEKNAAATESNGALAAEAEAPTQQKAEVKKPDDIIRKQVRNSNDAVKLECGTNSGQVDLVFLLDTSGSIFHTFGNEVALVKSLLSKLAHSIDAHSLRVSLITFAEKPSLAFSLNDALNGTEMLGRVDQVQFSGGVTQICDAIDRGQKEFEKFGRTGALKVFVLISDGHGHELWPKTLETGRNLRQQKMQRFAVSMSGDFSKDELMAYMGEANRIFVGFRQTLFEPTLLAFLNECLGRPSSSSNAENNDETPATVTNAAETTVATEAAETTPAATTASAETAEEETTVRNEAETTVKTEEETTVKNGAETTVKTEDETTVKTEEETTVKNEAETTVKTEEETTVKTEAETTVKTEAETTVKNKAETTEAPTVQSSENASVEESKTAENSNAPSSGGEIAAMPAEEEKTTEGSTISAVLTEQTNTAEAATNGQTTNGTSATEQTESTASTAAALSTEQTTVVNAPAATNEQTNSTNGTNSALVTDLTHPDQTKGDANQTTTADKTPNGTNSTADQTPQEKTENGANSTAVNATDQGNSDQAKGSTADGSTPPNDKEGTANSTAAQQTVPAKVGGITANATNTAQDNNQTVTPENAQNGGNSMGQEAPPSPNVNEANATVTDKTIPQKSADGNATETNANSATAEQSNANLTVSVQNALQNNATADHSQHHSVNNNTSGRLAPNVPELGNGTQATPSGNPNSTNTAQKDSANQSAPTATAGHNANSTASYQNATPAKTQQNDTAKATKAAPANGTSAAAGETPAEMQNVDDETKLKMMIMSSLASQAAAPHSSSNSTSTSKGAGAATNSSAPQSAGKKPPLPAADLANESAQKA